MNLNKKVKKNEKDKMDDLIFERFSFITLRNICVGRKSHVT